MKVNQVITVDGEELRIVGFEDNDVLVVPATDDPANDQEALELGDCEAISRDYLAS